MDVLKRLYNKDRPVRIVFIGLGPDVNAGELNSIAAATHGLAVVTRDPGGIRDMFLHALRCVPASRRTVDRVGCRTVRGVGQSRQKLGVSVRPRWVLSVRRTTILPGCAS